jgi:hypothetical protein
METTSALRIRSGQQAGEGREPFPAFFDGAVVIEPQRGRDSEGNEAVPGSVGAGRRGDEEARPRGC